MNLIDNGIDNKKPITVERIITEDKLCFEVTGYDWYGKKVTVEVTTTSAVKRIQDGLYQWSE